MWFVVLRLGFRVEGVEFRVQSLRLRGRARVQDVEVLVQG